MLGGALRKAVLSGVMVLALFGVALASRPEPPTGDERLSGPAIIGTVTLDGTTLSFVGACKGQEVLVASTPFPITLGTLTAESMEDFRIPEAGPAGCLSDAGGETLIVNTITKFTHLGNVVHADVVLMYLLPR